MARRVSTGPGVENVSRLACFHEAKRKIKTARPPPLGASVCSLRVPATHGTWCFKCLRLCSGVPHGVEEEEEEEEEGLFKADAVNEEDPERGGGGGGGGGGRFIQS